MKTLVHIVIVCFFGTTMSYAQIKPLLAPNATGMVLTTGYTHTSADVLSSGDTSWSKVRISNHMMQLSQSLLLSENDTAAISLDFRESSMKTDGRPIPLPDKLRSVSLNMENTHEFSKKWSLSLGIGAGSSAAEKGLLRRGWNVNAHAIWVCTCTPDFMLYQGFAYDSLSEDWKFVPVIGFDWTPAPAWSVALGIPKTSLSYSPRRDLTLSLELSGDGGTYALSDPKGDAGPVLSANGRRLEYTEARAGMGLVWKPGDRFAVSAAVGRVIYRKYKYLDNDSTLKTSKRPPFVSITICTAF